MRWHRALAVAGAAAGAIAGVGPLAVTTVASAQGAATGNYADRGGGAHVFVVNETRGHWGKAIEIPGAGALNKSGTLFQSSVACGLPGDCAAGGDYVGGRDHTFAFVASEVNGKWNKAGAVPRPAALHTGQDED